MKTIYPAVFHYEDNSYWVEFPDLPGCQSFGETLEETYKNAKEALGAYYVTALEEKININKPSSIKDIKSDDNSFATLVEADFSVKSKSVKKTLTIPSWLNDMAIEKNINFSQVLQDALKNQLHID